MINEEIKKEFIEAKEKQLDYIENIVQISRERNFSEKEKIEIYRKLNDFEIKLNEISSKYRDEIYTKKKRNPKEYKIEFDIRKNYLTILDDIQWKKESILRILKIDIEKYEYNEDMRYGRNNHISINELLYEQKMIENLYIFIEYADPETDYDEYGNIEDGSDIFFRKYPPRLIYFNYNTKRKTIIYEKDQKDFEKDKIILYKTC